MPSQGNESGCLNGSAGTDAVFDFEEALSLEGVENTEVVPAGANSPVYGPAPCEALPSCIFDFPGALGKGIYISRLVSEMSRERGLIMFRSTCW